MTKERIYHGKVKEIVYNATRGWHHIHFKGCIAMIRARGMVNYSKGNIIYFTASKDRAGREIKNGNVCIISEIKHVHKGYSQKEVAIMLHQEQDRKEQLIQEQVQNYMVA